MKKRNPSAKPKAIKATRKADKGDSIQKDGPHGRASSQMSSKELVKAKKKHLDERLRSLYNRAVLIERELRQLDDPFYRVCIFGSARIKPGSKEYKQAFELARFLSWEGIDILTGGGPGLMEAANMGAKLGQNERQTKSLSFGLSIQLEWEPDVNSHLDIKRHHYKFSSRLDDFMRLSHSVIATPGGIGTVLEVFFTWQLIQVKHIEKRPIVLLDRDFWIGLFDWMKKHPLGRALVSPGDFDYITIVDTPEEAAQIVSKHHQDFVKAKKVKR
jgi:uncharacterized protein (TIGR00730 family)